MVSIRLTIGDIEHELTPEQALILYERLRAIFNPPVQTVWTTEADNDAHWVKLPTVNTDDEHRR